MRGREAAGAGELEQHPADQKADRQRADIAEEEPRHRPVERRKADERAEQRRRHEPAIGRQRCRARRTAHERP